jgi:AcrR family transcriptional regulator
MILILSRRAVPKTAVSPASNGYHAHRERQRRRILQAAEKLFDERGIDRVTMADITSASGIRASTIYQYFSNKDDIVWAMLSEVFGADIDSAKQRIESAVTGLAKISSLLEFMADELSNNPAKVRFMAQFDVMYARDWPAERLLTLEAQINPQGFRYFSKLVRDGIADGSLRSDLDPNLTMHAVVNAVIGAQRRLASLGEKVEIEYGQPINRLFRETIRLIVLGLSATDSPIRTHPAERLKGRRSTRRKRSS